MGTQLQKTVDAIGVLRKMNRMTGISTTSQAGTPAQTVRIRFDEDDRKLIVNTVRQIDGLKRQLTDLLSKYA